MEEVEPKNTIIVVGNQATRANADAGVFIGGKESK